MTDLLAPFWFPLFLLVALLYSMVGLGGGSAYVAFLALAGVPHVHIPATALGLNLLVTAVGFAFHRRNLPERAGGRLLILYALAMSGAFLGSQVVLSARIFYLLLGGVLVGAAGLSWGQHLLRRRLRPVSPRWLAVYPFAFLFGLLAAMVGIGGGIFLAPVLLFSGFSAHQTAGITSLYIALNSGVGFAGHLLGGRVDAPLLLGLALAVLVGSLAGAWLGSRKVPERHVRGLLNLIVFGVGVRILWTGIRMP